MLSKDTPSGRPVILLVDDDPHDVVLIRLAFRKVGIIDTIQLVKNGTEAMLYIRGEGVYANRHQFQPPTLILLDLKMPQTSGFEVLQWIRQQPQLGSLVVVVMSSSSNEADIQQAYALGANLYLVKPSKFSDLVKMMESLKEFYFSGRAGEMGDADTDPKWGGTDPASDDKKTPNRVISTGGPTLG